MSLPPIISDLPFLNLFRTGKKDDGNDAGKEDGAQGRSSVPRDVVDLSEAAKAKLLEHSPLTEREALSVLGETKGALERTDLPLGLDPGFS